LYSNTKYMNLITPKKKEKLELINTIQAEYNILVSIPGAMKTAIYEELANKHNITSTTVRKYLAKKVTK